MTDYAKQFNDVCVLEQVVFPNRGVMLKINVKSGQDDEFNEVKMDL